MGRVRTILHGSIARAVALAAIAIMPAIAMDTQAAVRPTGQKVTTDTLRRAIPRMEMPSMQQRIMSSAHPVTITQQGRRLCVYSSYNQLLPIYRADGTFYQAFHLSKGTTWINGLPRGKYIINSKQYTIL